MTDKEKILKKIHDEMDGLMDAQGNFEYPEHEGAYHALCNLEAYIDSLPEDASGDLEEAADNYASIYKQVVGYDEDHILSVSDSYIAGANWQKEQMMKDAIEGLVICDEKLTHGYRDIVFKFPEELKVGDKVKMIIVKED